MSETAEMKRSRAVRAGSLTIGGGAPLTVQSMTNVPAEDFEGTAEQVLRLERAGCDIVRLAVPKTECAGVFRYVKDRGARCPLVADVHFDYRIALAAAEGGADKIRVNPGNLGEKWKVREVAECLKARGLPVRIGVNGGSLDKKLLEKYGAPTAEALAESAMEEAGAFEDCGFSDIVISIKSSSVAEMLRANRLVRGMSDYPLHIGLTEAGDAYSGLVKNAIGIGALLTEGIGDTLRVSLTADPEEEVRAGREILRAVGLDPRGTIDVISCPTCGRTKIDLIGLAGRYKEAVAGIDPRGKKLRVAVMGCVVNGPGEAREADFGIAGGDGKCVFFRGGERIETVPEEEAVDYLVRATLKALEE
ncbi:MAG: flavodoxin-dependent (E)-4-hydroxy-3-methylbut-2-enyl-diphosphate synthase [Ruminococcaceae bacterium]|nr:flavodoxin-dependent (E)-4-hydroxy-3-methylbut-2-enyl-diphosphate synthase [Oscillospiraceae bacterium]